MQSIKTKCMNLEQIGPEYVKNKNLHGGGTLKRIFVIVLILTLILSFAACSGPKNDDGPDATEPAGSQIPDTDDILTAKIAMLYDGTMLLMGADTGSLYMVTTALDVYDADGKVAATDSLKPGQTVEVGFSGGVMESYPMQLGEPAYVRITSQEDDMVGFYKTVLDDLWKVDEGLNSDISVLAFDLKNVTNLTDGEKSALVYVVSGEHGLEGITGTFDELSEQGYIDKDNLYFETGILFEFSLSDVTPDSFTFDVSKWRSGLGAYFYIDCKAVKNDGTWSYTVGSEAIS
jgi:hypothetical protein